MKLLNLPIILIPLVFIGCGAGGSVDATNTETTSSEDT